MEEIDRIDYARHVRMLEAAYLAQSYRRHADRILTSYQRKEEEAKEKQADAEVYKTLNLLADQIRKETSHG